MVTGGLRGRPLIPAYMDVGHAGLVWPVNAPCITAIPNILLVRTLTGHPTSADANPSIHRIPSQAMRFEFAMQGAAADVELRGSEADIPVAAFQ